MLRFIMLLEVIITGIYIYTMVPAQLDSLIPVFMLLIVYYILKLTYYIFQNRSFAKYILLGIIIFILAGCQIYTPLLFFLGLCVAQMYYTFFNNYGLLNYFFMISAILVPKEDLQLFFLVNLFSITCVIAFHSMQQEIIGLTGRWEKLNNRQKKLEESISYYQAHDASIVRQSKLEERNVLTQKLHDELGHTITGNILRLEAVSVVMDSDAEQAKVLLGESIENLRTGMDSVREILKSTKPDESDYNLSNIQLLASEVQEKSKIKTEVIYDYGNIEFSSDTWQIIQLNIKEALTNMMKYSGASRCQINFRMLNELYRISIKDNGAGCRNVKKGLGITGMEQRIAGVGGQLIIDGSNGFSMIMLIPVKKKGGADGS
jgi:signal transduction histidine kinase